MRTLNAKKLISCGLGLIVLACLWYSFAPAALGGHTTYVVTDGVSMEPRFHGGDLVLVRSHSSYRVGEIVAYHSKAFHTIVLHRIIGRAGDRYVFKGDNNNFVDFEHPAASQLIGALWLHLPGWGARLNSVRSPALIAGLAILGTLLLAGTAFTKRTRRRRRQRRADADAGDGQPPRTQLPQGLAEPVVSVLSFGLLALLPFVALALLAFTRAPSTLAPAELPYKQSGTLSYSADATPGPTYAGNRAVTGDPLFTHVLKNVNVQFAYEFHSASRHAVTGRATLDATINSSSGWQTTLALARPSYFHGDRGMVTGTLDLPSLLALMQRVQNTTKVNGSYTLTLVPHVSTRGTVDALPLNATFAPRIPFSLSELELEPAVSKGSSSASGEAATSPFAPSASGSVTARRYRPLYVSLKLLTLTVTSARWIALGGILLVACALVAALAFVRPRRRELQPVVPARYEHLIVPVARVWPLPGVAVIDVADIEALVRLAEHYDRSILREQVDGGEAFWVADESGQFRYAVGAVEHTLEFAPEPVFEAIAEPEAEPLLAPEPVADDGYARELGGSEWRAAREAVAASATPGRTAIAHIVGFDWEPI